MSPKNHGLPKDFLQRLSVYLETLLDLQKVHLESRIPWPRYSQSAGSEVEIRKMVLLMFQKSSKPVESCLIFHLFTRVFYISVGRSFSTTQVSGIFDFLRF